MQAHGDVCRGSMCQEASVYLPAVDEDSDIRIAVAVYVNRVAMSARFRTEYLAPLMFSFVLAFEAWQIPTFHCLASPDPSVLVPLLRYIVLTCHISLWQKASRLPNA